MRIMIIGSMDGYISEAAKISIQRGAKVAQCDKTDIALDMLRQGKGADLIMMEVTMPVGHFIEQLKNERIHVPVIVCGIGTETTQAVSAIRAGAKEYIPLPPDPELIAAVFEAISQEEFSLLYKSKEMKQLVEIANQVAPSEATILITGESGTGKEVIAKYVHRKSRRKDQAFVSINCAAIPEHLLESELFGHEKGSFTGALARRIGKFEEANGGTLLLDEISEMDIRLQAKLLRAIQEKEIDRVGGTKPIKVDIRILATSNRDLIECVKNGTFREDLYFRLNVVNLHLLPLRERKDDILELANHFVQKYSDMNHVPLRSFHPDTITKIMDYDWPGNVRELENIIHRAVILSRGEVIYPDAINIQTKKGKESSSSKSQFIGSTLANVERDLILNTLDHCLGNRTHAANILGISIRTLRNKLKQYALDEAV